MVLLTLPLGFLVAALSGARIQVVPCFIVLALYGWIWLRFRPSSFVVTDQSLNVIWPLKPQEIPRETISTVRLLNREELKQEIGWSLRVGAGGFGGGVRLAVDHTAWHHTHARLSHRSLCLD